MAAVQMVRAHEMFRKQFPETDPHRSFIEPCANPPAFGAVHIATLIIRV